MMGGRARPRACRNLGPLQRCGLPGTAQRPSRPMGCRMRRAHSEGSVTSGRGPGDRPALPPSFPLLPEPARRPRRPRTALPRRGLTRPPGVGTCTGDPPRPQCPQDAAGEGAAQQGGGQGAEPHNCGSPGVSPRPAHAPAPATTPSSPGVCPAGLPVAPRTPH